MNHAFTIGERVRVTTGNFENFEGVIHSIDQSTRKVIVMLNIFGRDTPVEVEYQDIEKL